MSREKNEAGIRREAYLRPLLDNHDRRRVGKTTILRQVINELLASGGSPHDICFLTLDHPSLAGTTISDHLKAFRTLFGHPRNRRLFLFLDEVQDSPAWEVELKSLHDTEQLKLYCTDSTSALLARQGGKLTGRQITTTIFPRCGVSLSLPGQSRQRSRFMALSFRPYHSGAFCWMPDSF